MQDRRISVHSNAGGGELQHSAGVTFLGAGRLCFSDAIHGSALRLSAHLHAWKVIDPVRLLLVAFLAAHRSHALASSRPDLRSTSLMLLLLCLNDQTGLNVGVCA
jgi:hypothetical protein